MHSKTSSMERAGSTCALRSELAPAGLSGDGRGVREPICTRCGCAKGEREGRLGDAWQLVLGGAGAKMGADMVEPSRIESRIGIDWEWLGCFLWKVMGVLQLANFRMYAGNLFTFYYDLIGWPHYEWYMKASENWLISSLGTITRPAYSGDWLSWVLSMVEFGGVRFRAMWRKHTEAICSQVLGFDCFDLGLSRSSTYCALLFLIF